MTALILEADGRFTYMNRVAYDLGHQRPGRYVFAWRSGQSKQPCSGGGFRGNTVSWPAGALTGYSDGKDRLGRTIRIPAYHDLPEAEVLKSLGKTLNARTYKSRAAFEQHYKDEEEFA